MRIRLIGLGETGQRIVLKVSQTFRAHGLLDFLEHRYVVRLSTPEFVNTYIALSNLAGAATPPATPRELLALRVSLAEVFFGGGHPESGTHRKILTLLGERMSSENRHLFDRAEKTGLAQHQHLMEPLTAELGEGWLIVPRVPLKAEPFPLGNAVMGVELLNAVPEGDYRNGVLIHGLGTSESGVDIVAIAFDGRDAFGAEGAATLCTAIRRVLMARRANRIVCLLGLAILTPQGAYPAGRFLGDYVRLTRRDYRMFDGMIARPAGEQTEADLPLALLGLALSSNPRTIQTDNPDANQVQRDFGRSLVGFGAASAADVVVPPPLPQQPAHPLPAPAPNPTGGIEKQTARKVIAYLGYDNHLSGQDLKVLRQRLAQDFPHSQAVIYKYRLRGVRGNNAREAPPAAPGPSLLQLYDAALERWTRGHCVVGTVFQQQFAQEMLAQPWHTVPWIQRLIQAGQAQPAPLPEVTPPAAPAAPPAAPAPSPGGFLQIVRHIIGAETQQDLPPLPRHLILFVVDSFETRAIDTIASFLEEQGEIFDESLAVPAWINRGDALIPGRAEQRKRCFLARSLVSLPDTKTTWAPPLYNHLPRSYAQGNTLAQPDLDYFNLLSTRVPQYLRAENGEPHLTSFGMHFTFECPTPNFDPEADAIADTLDMVPGFLSRFLEPTLRTLSWVTEVLGGLNLLCNEQIEPRRVGSSVGDLFLNVHHRPPAAPAGN